MGAAPGLGSYAQLWEKTSCQLALTLKFWRMMPAGFGRIPTRRNKKWGTKGPQKIIQRKKFLNYLNLSFGLRLVWNTAKTTFQLR
jgi:hypothetical protein